MFYIVGPLRTGSSLLARCLDDHPDVICFCESEINRAIFSPYYVHLHFVRMRHHGLDGQEIAKLLDRKRQDEAAEVMRWYDEAAAMLGERYEKRNTAHVGDKSPDFYLAPSLVETFLSEHRLFYTIRDPRAIFHSIDRSEGSTPLEKRNRWNSLIRNFEFWEPLLDTDPVHCLRYEDLVTHPDETMERVYGHLGLTISARFSEPFSRLFPSRFLWKTAIDWESGIHRDFDPARADRWRSELNREQVQFVQSDPVVVRIMNRFGYQS
jgi:hypothetical protein